MPRPQKGPPKSSSARPAAEESAVAGVRIIGGTLRGRLLEYSGDERTRPMKDRVRESVFNLIGPAVVGKHALDLFAGTGALGLEALSRGASFATFIERHYPTSQVIKNNARKLGIEEKCDIVFGDAFLWTRRTLAPADPHKLKSSVSSLKSQISNLKSPTPWLVFCSPPYEFYVSRLEEMLAMIQSLWSAAPAESQFVVEADERFDFALLPQPEKWDVRSYPPARVALAEANTPLEHA